MPLFFVSFAFERNLTTGATRGAPGGALIKAATRAEAEAAAAPLYPDGGAGRAFEVDPDKVDEIMARIEPSDLNRLLTVDELTRLGFEPVAANVIRLEWMRFQHPQTGQPLWCGKGRSLTGHVYATCIFQVRNKPDDPWLVFTDNIPLLSETGVQQFGSVDAAKAAAGEFYARLEADVTLVRVKAGLIDRHGKVTAKGRREGLHIREGLDIEEGALEKMSESDDDNLPELEEKMQRLEELMSKLFQSLDDSRNDG